MVFAHYYEKNYARWAVQRLEQEPSHEKKRQMPSKSDCELIKFIKDFIDATTQYSSKSITSQLQLIRTEKLVKSVHKVNKHAVQNDFSKEKSAQEIVKETRQAGIELNKEDAFRVASDAYEIKTPNVHDDVGFAKFFRSLDGDESDDEALRLYDEKKCKSKGENNINKGPKDAAVSKVAEYYKTVLSLSMSKSKLYEILRDYQAQNGSHHLISFEPKEDFQHWLKSRFFQDELKMPDGNSLHPSGQNSDSLSAENMPTTKFFQIDDKKFDVLILQEFMADNRKKIKLKYSKDVSDLLKGSDTSISEYGSEKIIHHQVWMKTAMAVLAGILKEIEDSDVNKRPDVRTQN